MKNRELLEKVIERESELFWDRKARFTYYVLTLPFALFGGAIASYRPPTGVEACQLYIEFTAWVLFLLSGLSGLISKWGEMEVARMSSIISKGNLVLLDDEQRVRGRTEQDSKQSREQENKRLKAEKAESAGGLLLKFLFPTGCVVWVVSRVFLHL